MMKNPTQVDLFSVSNLSMVIDKIQDGGKMTAVAILEFNFWPYLGH